MKDAFLLLFLFTICSAAGAVATSMHYRPIVARWKRHARHLENRHATEKAALEARAVLGAIQQFRLGVEAGKRSRSVVLMMPRTAGSRLNLPN